MEFNEVMDVNQMLRTIINGQSAMKADLLGEIGKVREEVMGVKKDVEELGQDLKNTEKRLTKRIDMVGLSLAELDHDTPTMNEFDGLEKRVIKLEDNSPNN